MKHRSAPLVLFAFALFALVAPATRAQGHTIRGKVRTAEGVSVPRATVTLEIGSGGATIQQTVTNNEGDFAFTGLTGTSYIVVVSVPDFNPASEHVEFVREINGDTPGETHIVEITLLAKGGVRSPRAGLNFAQSVPKAARDAFESGVKLARENKPAEAVAAYEGAIKIFPDYFDAHLVIASELARQGKLDDAIKHLQEARRVNGRDDRVWDLFACVLVRQRKFAVAARIFGEAARLNPTDAQYLVSQASAFIEQASSIDPSKSKPASDEREFAFAEAEKSLARAEQLDRKLAEVNLQRARLYEKRGDRARAAAELEQYLRKAPNAKNAEGVRQAIKTLRAQAAAPKTP
jgi:tetratricopeptide (TPR) repeat protein